ncbi:transmembrane protein 154-like [Arapaima gigas]
MSAEPNELLLEISSGDFSHTEVYVQTGDSSADIITSVSFDSPGLLLPQPDTGATISPLTMDSSAVWLAMFALALTLLVGSIIVVLLVRRWKKKQPGSAVKADYFFDDCNADKIPSPMFEDDIPSVMELDMEDLDQWQAISEDKQAAEEIPGGKS